MVTHKDYVKGIQIKRCRTKQGQSAGTNGQLPGPALANEGPDCDPCREHLNVRVQSKTKD